MASPGNIRLGTIILADVHDPDTGELLPPHYCVNLTPQSEIDAGEDLRTVVCTTNCFPMKSGWFFIPAKPGGDEQTGLSEAGVVKATWQETVPQSKIIKIQGRCPVPIVKQIQAWQRDKQRDAERRRKGEP